MFWLLLIFSYLLGSISFAIVLSKLFGADDPRLLGSGNPGATNMMRIAGAKLALLTLLGDLLKGALPVLIAKALNLNPQQQIWIGIAAVFGHLYPFFFHFKGGKGVATTAGMLLTVIPLFTLIAFVVWGITFYKTRTSSIASLTALLVITILTALLKTTLLLPILILLLLILWRHRRNLHNLVYGNEYRF